ncbi:MAG TPA: hypothetical protein VMG99_02890 [Thermoplasmata archaeon]|nr:hypothetical protein [Thermoplasmata archaeon]
MALFGLPPLGVNDSLVTFVIIALAMIAVTIFVLSQILPVAGRPPLVTQALIGLLVIFSGSILLLSLLFVFLNPDGTSAWTLVLLAFNFMMMGPVGVWFIGLVLYRDRRIDARSWIWPAAIALVTTGSEAIMGVLFVVGSGAGSTWAAAFALGLNSVWYFWSMGAIMVALVVWAPLARLERGALFALTASSVLAPWVTAYPTAGGLAMGLLMTVVFLGLVHRLGQPRAGLVGELGLLFGLAGAFLATAVAGFYVAAASGSIAADLTFGGVMAAVMTVEVAYLFRRFYRGIPGVPWVARAVNDVEPADLVASRTSGPLGPSAPTGPAAPLPPPAANR